LSIPSVSSWVLAHSGDNKNHRKYNIIKKEVIENN
jgi:hypothetical protein